MLLKEVAAEMATKLESESAPTWPRRSRSSRMCDSKTCKKYF